MARKLSFWEGIKAQFSTKCLVLIPIAQAMVAIPLVGDRQIDLIEAAIAALVAADQQDG